LRSCATIRMYQSVGMVSMIELFRGNCGWVDASAVIFDVE